jgi:DNA mismatch repair protein MutS
MTPQTPMLRQYFAVKAEHPGVLMAIRIGDFYEFYGEDAELAAASAEITLTGREDGSNGRIPMAGVPFHSIEKYLIRLIQKGHKVALCEQLEDPKQAKGLVKRGVTRVLTPGTLVEDSMLSSGQNSYLAAICVQKDRTGLAILDPSTGEFNVTEVSNDRAQELLFPELARIRPAELLYGPDADPFAEMAQQALGTVTSGQPSLALERATRKLLQQFQAGNLAGFGCEDKPGAVIAASMVLAYAEKNGLPLQHIEQLSTYSVDGFMRLDPSTRRSLELTQNLHDGSKRFTLLAALDQTLTPMGARLIRRWIEQPLLNQGTIQARLDAVERLINNPMARGDLRDLLSKVADLERLVARCSTGHANPRDLVALRASLLALPFLEDPLVKVALGRLFELKQDLADHRELANYLSQALVDDPPFSVREGGLIRPEFDLELDKLRELARDGKSFIAALEKTEREKTGINSLKVGFNNVFGYYLEVSKQFSASVPDTYIRKQTTANAERYITAELKDQESLVLGAQEKSSELESHLFFRVRQRVAENAGSLLQTARALAELDVLATFAEVSVRNRYVKPTFAESDEIRLRAGRHPVVELASASFVPNDTDLGEKRIMILTGPNMAGKSTFLRQNALVQLMLQVGCFVPAESATLSLCDRIFARIGAKDELALGQSTFMVEMLESANILNHATPRSLVILDEVGRGTSTFDGLAIAWAMIEHLAEIGAKTLFATHYHQLNALADQLPSLANYRVAVEEIGQDIVWTHRVLPGGTDRSYGIHVAQRAGVPASVLRRAREVLADLEQTNDAPKSVPLQHQKLQLTLFDVEEPAVVQALKDLDVNQLTPIQALRLLDDWKRQFGTGG